MDSEPKLVFAAQWYQSEASLMREFVLNFFPRDNSIELIDTKPKKTFLKRIPVDTVCAKDLFIGARVFVFGRKIHIVDFGNLETKLELASKLQRGFLLVPGQLIGSLDEIFKKISSLNLYLSHCFMIQISSDDLIKVDLMDDKTIMPIKSNLLDMPSVVFELTGKSIDKKVEDIQESFPAVFGSISEPILNHFFHSQSMNQILPRKEHQRSILCLIKPHIVHGNQTGDLLSSIFRNDFRIVNLKVCHLDRDQCDEFLRVYEGVLPEFIQMSIHLASGPLLAVELVSREPVEDLHSKFRNLCGPLDSEIAKQIRPHTLRAEYGVNKIMNAVHCTDLQEDVESEVNFFFS